MGCCYSTDADHSLLRSDAVYDLQPFKHDEIYGPCYINAEVSRYIRGKCISMDTDTIRLFMRSFPQLHYQIGGSELARERFYRGPNNIRFILDGVARCKLVLFG
jgi:hypothetical protein